MCSITPIKTLISSSVVGFQVLNLDHLLIVISDKNFWTYVFLLSTINCINLSARNKLKNGNRLVSITSSRNPGVAMNRNGAVDTQFWSSSSTFEDFLFLPKRPAVTLVSVESIDTSCGWNGIPPLVRTFLWIVSPLATVSHVHQQSLNSVNMNHLSLFGMKGDFHL